MSDDDQGGRPSEDEGGASDKPVGKRFPTVGIGTSAGGVHALQMFFESLPDDVDAAFVVVVHLDPGRQSELSNILATRTKMPVTQVTARRRWSRATSMSSRPTANFAPPTIISRSPRSTSRA